MTLQFKNIYSIASNLANLVISEKGSGYYISIDGIKKNSQGGSFSSFIIIKSKNHFRKN